MPGSSRLYHCCRCQAQVIICSRCDRGQRYCAGSCSHEARSASLKRASKNYQSSRSGRFNNAARQRRYRARQKQKVTHQGSPVLRTRDLLKNKATRSASHPKQGQSCTTIRCHHCGVVCGPFLRHDFLHRGRFERSFRRQSG